MEPIIGMIVTMCLSLQAVPPPGWERVPIVSSRQAEMMSHACYDENGVPDDRYPVLIVYRGDSKD